MGELLVVGHGINDGVGEVIGGTSMVKRKQIEEDFYTKMLEEKELLDMGLKESIKQKEERTPSQDMQDKLEPIPCPMHEDYDD